MRKLKMPTENEKRLKEEIDDLQRLLSDQRDNIAGLRGRITSVWLDCVRRMDEIDTKLKEVIKDGD